MNANHDKEVRINQVLLIAEGREAAATGRAKKIRVAAHLHQSDVARMLGITTSAVCKWERGQRLPLAEVAADYARLLRRLEGSKSNP